MLIQCKVGGGAMQNCAVRIDLIMFPLWLEYVPHLNKQHIRTKYILARGVQIEAISDGSQEFKESDIPCCAESELARRLN